MRVITGTARGRRLQTPPGLDTRPTSEKVKEAVMSAIQFELEGARVLDLFAGSGQMGIEALSRGARSCVFVDNSSAAQAVLRQNLLTTGLRDQAHLVGTDALSWLRGAKGPFDIVFVDPPYAKGLVPKVLEALVPLLSQSGVILCETATEQELPQRVGAFALHKRYRYGKTGISAYRADPENL